MNPCVAKTFRRQPAGPVFMAGIAGFSYYDLDDAPYSAGCPGPDLRRSTPLAVLHLHPPPPLVRAAIPSPRTAMTETPIPEATTPEPASRWEDFIDIFVSPREVFARRADGSFAVPLLVATVVIVALFFAMQSALATAFDAEFQRGMAQSAAAGQQMTAEQMATARKYVGIGGAVALIFFIPLGVLVTGVLAWALGKLFDSVATIKPLVMVATYALFPRILQAVAAVLIGLLFEPPTLAAASVGPAHFVDPATTSAWLVQMLLRLDVFMIWSTILIAIGLQVVGRVRKGPSFVVAALVWLLGAIPTVLPALLRG